MRAVFFGSPDAALPSIRALLRAGHEIPLVVTQPDRPSGRGKHRHIVPVKQFALERGIPVIQPEKIRRDPDVLDLLKTAAADIHVVVAYGQIIPMSVIALPRFSTINVHFSILPRHRGAAPVAAAILAGDARTGVTIFRLNEKMDEGDILTTVETDIGPRETAGDLESRLAELGAALLLDTLENIDRLAARPQDSSRATLAPKIRKEEGHLDWRRPAFEIDRRVRAMTPRPNAHTHLKGSRLIVLSGETTESDGPENPPPGTIVGLSKRGILVACGDGMRYLIAAVRPENRPAMSAHAFTLGGRADTGDVLESRKLEEIQNSFKI